MFASEFSSGLDEAAPKSSSSIQNEKHGDRRNDRTISSRGKAGTSNKRGTSNSTDKVFKYSLFRQNPDVPKVKPNHHIVPITEPLFSSKTFQDFDLHAHMVANLEQNLSVTQVTSVQELSIPALQKENDVLIRSQTGSGKTLAYAVPIIDQLHRIRPKLSRSDGLKVLIVLPTRELAIQTYEWFVKLVKPYTWLVPGLLMGGEKRKSEKARLRRGITILIGTPGRLLDHTKHTKNLKFESLKWLIIDEADRLLELGYERDVTSLIEIIDKDGSNHQTVLLSATLTKEVERLAGLSLKNPIKIDVASENPDNVILDNSLIIPDSLKQFYTIVPPKLRLVTLASVLLDKCSKDTDEGKILVFMGTQAMVDYHTELFATVLPEVNFYKLHGKMTQVERTEVFKSFRAYKNGVLMCSDVAARGLDLPQVDWIIQYTAPVAASDYVHRVGRTARVGLKGNSLLLLAPQEVDLIRMLQNYRIKITEEKMETFLQKLTSVHFAEDNHNGSMESAATMLQVRFERAVLDQGTLRQSGCEAFVSWARFYASYPKEMREVFKFKELHLGHYAKSFALRDPPKVISGIGKPKHIKKHAREYDPARRNRLSFDNKNFRKRKSDPTNEVNEFESGLRFKTKIRKT